VHGRWRKRHGERLIIGGGGTDESGSRHAREDAIWRGRHGEERRRRSLEEEAGGACDVCGARSDGLGAGQERAAGVGESKPHMSALGGSGLGENAAE
jgi:hypothetical protein